VYVSPATYKKFLASNENQEPVYVKINNCAQMLRHSAEYSDQDIALGKFARQILQIPLNDSVRLQLFKPPREKEFRLSVLQLELELVTRTSD
jgi:vesicle-fusing ATPase